MTKNLLAIVFLCLAMNSYGQIFQAGTETGSRYNPANDSLVVYDDCIVTLPTAGSYSVKVTQITLGIRRLANAPDVDVALYFGRGAGDTLPQTIDSLTLFQLAANGASSLTQTLTYTNASGFNLNLTPLTADPTKATLFIGTRFLGPNFANANNGWRINNTPAIGVGSNSFILINRVLNNTILGKYTFSGGTTPAYFMTSITGTFQAPLPVNISLFKANLINGDAILNWTTETETNSSHFEVEVSKNGIDFFTLGKVAAAGTSNSTKSYTFKQVKPSKGTYFYRLKMVDKDNTFKYSAIEKVVVDSKQIQLVVMPNPVVSTIKFNWVEEGQYRYQLIGIEGKQFKIGAVINGMNAIDVSNLSKGTYVLDVKDATGKTAASQIIIKQ